MEQSIKLLSYEKSRVFWKGFSIGMVFAAVIAAMIVHFTLR